MDSSQETYRDEPATLGPADVTQAPAPPPQAPADVEANDPAQPRGPSRPATLYARLAQWLTGVDPQLLATCSRSQHTLYDAIAVLMILAALLTGAGVGAKLSSLWELGSAGGAVVSALVFVMALAMEAAVLASIGPAASVFSTLAVRVPIGALLVALQIMPVLTTILRPEIELGLQERGLAQQATLKDKVADLLDVSRMKADAQALEARHAQTLARQANPPDDAGVRSTEAQQAKAVAAQTRAEVAMKAAQRRLAGVKQMPIRTGDQERMRLLLARAQEAYEKSRSRFSVATAAVDNAEAAVSQAKSSRDAALAGAVSAARQAAEAQNRKVIDTELQFNAQMRKGQEVVAAANTRNFISEVTMLMRLAVRDWAIGLTVLCTLLGFALLDLLPTMLKVAARRGTYAALVAHADEQTVAHSRWEAELQREDNEQTLLIKRNQTAGVLEFTRQDGGALDSQQLLQERQHENDLRASTASMTLARASLEQLGEIQEILIAQHERTLRHPEVAAAYRQQLAHLLAELQTRAGALASAAPAAAAAGA